MDKPICVRCKRCFQASGIFLCRSKERMTNYVTGEKVPAVQAIPCEDKNLHGDCRDFERAKWYNLTIKSLLFPR